MRIGLLVAGVAGTCLEVLAVRDFVRGRITLTAGIIAVLTADVLQTFGFLAFVSFFHS